MGRPYKFPRTLALEFLESRIPGEFRTEAVNAVFFPEGLADLFGEDPPWDTREFFGAAFIVQALRKDAPALVRSMGKALRLRERMERSKRGRAMLVVIYWIHAHADPRNSIPIPHSSELFDLGKRLGLGEFDAKDLTNAVQELRAFEQSEGARLESELPGILLDFEGEN